MAATSDKNDAPQLGKPDDVPAARRQAATSNKRAPAPPEFFRFVYWAFLSAVFVLLGILLFRPLFVSSPYWLLYIQHIALAVVAVCFGFWIGDSAKYLAIREDLRKAIFTTFVVVILGAAAGYIVSVWKRPPQLGLRAMLFDEGSVKPQPGGKYLPDEIAVRTNQHYRVPKGETLRIFVAVAVSNFAVDVGGRNDLELHIAFVGGGSTIADSYVVPQQDPNDWVAYEFPKRLGKEVVERATKLMPQETLFLMHLRIEKEALLREPRTGELRILARDKATSASAEWKLPVTLELNAVN
jgi:hypothetical protein